MNEQKLAPIIVISCLAIIIITALMYDNKQKAEIQTILESEDVSELEYPATLYQLPVNKNVEDVAPSIMPTSKVISPLASSNSTEEKEDQHAVVSSPLPKKADAKVADKKDKAQAQHKTTGRYYIQIGAYKQHAGAKKMAAKLSKDKWSIQIVRRKGLHLLWVGPLKTRDQAKRFQKKLLKNRSLKGFIVKR